MRCEMMKKKMSWQLTLGIMIFAIITVLRQFTELPEYIYGLGYGLCISLELYGLLAMKHDMSKLRNLKRKLIGLKGE